MAGEEHDRDQPGVLRVFQTREQTRRFYDKIARVYDVLAEHSEGPVRQRGLELLAVGPGERVLEIGVGTGHCLEALARAVGPGGAVHGVDLSEGMLRQSRERLEQEGLAARVQLWQADAAALPHEEASFDAVFLSFTLELFDTPEIPAVLAECRRVLRPGGRIGVVSMSKGDHERPLVKLYEWTHEHFPNFVDCRPIHVRRAVEDAGFTVEAAESMRMWVPVELVVGRKP